MTSFHAAKCHLASKNEASVARICSNTRQFLICSTFVLVVTRVRWMSRSKLLNQFELSTIPWMSSSVYQSKAQ